MPTQKKKAVQKRATAVHRFSLVIGGVSTLNEEVENALFEAGCDDATFSIQHRQLYADFSRTARTLKDAILSAIRDIRKANIGATVLRVDECNFVSPSDIARRIGRSRQQVYQYMSGDRGPGDFPSPECYLNEGNPLWMWTVVCGWLARNNILRDEDRQNAHAVAMINALLDLRRLELQSPDLARDLQAALG